jgi:hypothetical protein
MKESMQMSDRANQVGRRHWIAGMGASCVGAAAWLLTRRAQAADDTAAPVRPAQAEPLRVLDDLGVELMMVRLDASEFLIDLRYRVRDIAKAQPLLERRVQPVLVNETTGDRYYIPQAPKVGSLKQSATSKQPAIVGRVYFMLFANPDRKLKSGERVTLYAGDSVIKDLVVR